MVKNTLIKLEFVSDITFMPIAHGIKKKSLIPIQLHACDIAQQMQYLMHKKSSADVLILHCTPDFYMQKTSESNLTSFEDDFFAALVSFVSVENAPWVILNTIEVFSNSLVNIENINVIIKLNAINNRLMQLALEHSRIRIVNSARILAKLGEHNAYSLKNSFVMKLPYKTAAVNALAEEYLTLINQLYLPRKKVLAVDADNTLWGGILGEEGIANLQIDPHNYPGVIYWEFQLQLKAAKEAGLLLVLVSKNNDADIVEAFQNIRMPLSMNDFVARQVNWSPKSDNIKHLAELLNLGVDSFIFIDDNSFEIEQVRHALPMVDCYQFVSANPEGALSLLMTVNQLSTWRLTSEDANKTEQYVQEVKRSEVKAKTHTLQEYLESLELRLEYGINRRSEIARIAQLTNKTNQFNLTTRRYTELNIEELMQNNKVYDFRVIDRYGDMGIVGICIIKENIIDTFLMSCRALGREVESTMLKIICEHHNHEPLVGAYIKSTKNQMVQSFYEENGFAQFSTNGDTCMYRCTSGPKPLLSILINKIPNV